MSRKLTLEEREIRRLEHNKRGRELYHSRIEYEHEQARLKYIKFKDRASKRMKTWKGIVKRFVIGYYSDGSYSCKCCGERMYGFLTIDHIINGGTKHRKIVKKNTDIYFWLRENLFPEGYQVLCYNCNCAKQFNHGCPHNIGGFMINRMGSPSKVEF